MNAISFPVVPTSAIGDYRLAAFYQLKIHLLVQACTKVLNEEWEDCFRQQ